MAAFATGIAVGQSSFSSIENTSDSFGACGSPGLRLCSNFSCASSNSLQIDSYSGQDLCNLAAPSCTTSQFTSTTSGNGTDITFLVITDTHLHNGYGMTDADHLHHTQAINMISNLGLNWRQAGAGFDNLPFAVSQPPSVVTTGDSTNYGQEANLGAFRLLYEQGASTDAINYRVYPGLGNHDIADQCEFASCGRRMFDYISNVASCFTNMDSGSHNYSWDWGQFHMVQLNMWAGDTGLGTDTSTGYAPTHTSGLGWLSQDLANNVGTSGRPVILFQHFGWDYFSIFNNNSNGQADPWWDSVARQQVLDIVKDYNVIALFSGHQHQTAMYGVNFTDDSGHARILDDFTGGAGGIGGFGQFFGVRLTQNFLDVLPFEWEAGFANEHPYMMNVGSSDPDYEFPYAGWNPNTKQNGTTPWAGGTPLYPMFYNNVFGCRKWIGGPLTTIPLTITQDPNTINNVIITNNTGGTLQGPFALQLPIISGSGALASVSFMGSCSQGPAYQNLTSTQLGPGQSETVTLNFQNGSDTVAPLNGLSQFRVVSLGADSLVASPEAVTITASTSATASVSTILGKTIPFTIQADSQLTVTTDNTQTPATLTIALNPNAQSINKASSLHVIPTTAGYSSAKIVVNLAAVPITVTASGNAPIIADGSTYNTPHTFNWYPGDVHNLTAQSIRQIDSGTQDRFTSWSAGGAASTPAQGTSISVTVPLAAANYIASYGRYYLVTPTVNPPNSGTVILSPASPDGYEIAGTSLTVTATPNSGYAFSSFSGIASNPTGGSFNQTMEAPLSFSVQFAPGGTFTVTTQFQASGSETVDGQTHNGPVSQAWTTGSSHTFSVPAEIDANTTRYLFTGWSDGVTDNPRTITAGTPVTYLANYQTQFLVSTSVSPAGAGTLTGGGWYNKGGSASLQATPASGFQFSSFSGSLGGSTDPQSHTVIGPMNVVANFQSSGTPALYASAGPRIDTDPAISVFTFELTDSGVGAAVNAQIDSVTATPSIGTGTITVPGLPLAFGTILPGQAATQTININWPNTATRVAFTVHFSANSGTYKGQSTFYLFR
jgi:cytolysin (calcineurin-like family phosphatase)